MLLSEAKDVRVGSAQAQAVYAGDVMVWSGTEIPSTITGLGLWLEADAITDATSGGQIGTWPEKSANHYPVTPYYTAPVWQQAGVNGHPTVRFTGPSRMLIQGWGNALSNKSEFTLFHVVSSENMGNWPIVLTAPTYSAWLFLTEFDLTTDFYWGQNTYYDLYDTNLVSGQSYLLTCSLGASGAKFYKDGVQQSKVPPNNIWPATPPLGGDVFLGQYYDTALGLIGNVSAILWYDRFLIDSERVQIETYLKSKYGIT
jgi:hypothetical protein